MSDTTPAFSLAGQAITHAPDLQRVQPGNVYIYNDPCSRPGCGCLSTVIEAVSVQGSVAIRLGSGTKALALALLQLAEEADPKGAAGRKPS